MALDHGFAWVPHFLSSSVSRKLCGQKTKNWMKNVFQTNERYEEDDLKRAADASRDTRFSAILAIAAGIAIALFFIFIELIVPTFA